jgi:hypothetical protein
MRPKELMVLIKRNYGSLEKRLIIEPALDFSRVF